MYDQIVKTQSLQQQEDTNSTRNVRGEMKTTTNFKRSAIGNIAIKECDPHGKFITIENTNKIKVCIKNYLIYFFNTIFFTFKDEDISGCKIKRKIEDIKKEINYVFPQNTILKAGRTIKIYGREVEGSGSLNSFDSLINENEPSWGVGFNVVTIFYNKDGKECATHIQTTTQVGQ